MVNTIMNALTCGDSSCHLHHWTPPVTCRGHPLHATRSSARIRSKGRLEQCATTTQLHAGLGDPRRSFPGRRCGQLLASAVAVRIMSMMMTKSRWKYRSELDAGFHLTIGNCCMQGDKGVFMCGLLFVHVLGLTYYSIQADTCIDLSSMGSRRIRRSTVYKAGHDCTLPSRTEHEQCNASAGSRIIYHALQFL